jgi:small ligand-binding sensory domain FIST
MGGPSGTRPRRCHAALSVHPLAAAATGEVVGEVLEAMGPGADLAVVVACGTHTESIDAIVGTVRSMLGTDVVLWATASGVIGGGRGVEEGPGLTLFVARLGAVTPVGLDEAGVDALPDEGTLVVVGTGGPGPVPHLLEVLARERPGIVVAGGLVPPRLRSGISGQSATDRPVTASGILLPTGAAEVIVSQGCRAVGDPVVVTRARGHVIEQLAGRDALDRVDELVAGLSPGDRALAARNGLQLGWVVDERSVEPGPDDVLMRTVVGAIKGTRAMAVDDQLPVGALVQFHLRDPAEAAAQLGTQLARRIATDPAAGALLFTCNGRGQAQFGTSDHDPMLVTDQVGPAVAGMFCAGEIGPVGGRSWLHSFTATTILVRA